MLASAGRKTICIWDVSDKKRIAEFPIPRPCIAVTFTPDNKSLMVACHDNQVHVFDIASSECLESQQWCIDEEGGPIHRVPDTAAFSLEHKLLAVVYRGSHIYIWSWEDGYLGSCKKPHAEQEVLPFHASSLCFSPASEANSLAASYKGGTILVFDPLEEDENIKASHKADTDAQTLACSPCGRTLISGDSRGTIRIFDFETFDDVRLKLMYVIYGRESNIRSLAFCLDSLRFVDIRGQQTNIWEPTVLVRHVISEEMSETAFLETQEAVIPEAVELGVITAMCVDPSGKYVFCGTEGGKVNVFSGTTGKQSQLLYDHFNGIPVTLLTFSGSKSILASADSSSRVLIWQLTVAPNCCKTSSLLQEHRMEEPVESLLLSPPETQILIVTTLTDRLCSLTTPKTDPISLTWTTRNTGIWAQHPTNPSQLLLVVRSTIRIYTWAGLKQLNSPSGISLHVENDLLSDLEIRAANSGWAGRLLVTQYSALSHRRSRIQFLLWDVNASNPTTERLAPLNHTIGDKVARLVGTFGMIICITNNLILLLDDDGWVCSLEAGEVWAELRTYKRHFFLPTDWLSTNDGLNIAYSKLGNVIFAKEDEVAVIRKGLECVEEVEFVDGFGVSTPV